MSAAKEIPFYELFPYQEEGARWLKDRELALLADEMGLGKSAQVISACDRINANRICIVAPAIARWNWVDEFNIFSIFGKEFEVVLKNKKKWDKTKSIICSYEGATAVEDPGEFDVLVCDEAHYLKSIEAKRTTKVLGKKGLIRKSKRFWALTGTPAPNHPGELWPLLLTTGITELPYWDFVKKFCEVQETGFGMKIHGAKKSSIPELKKLLKGVMLRRLKKDVMKELPEIVYSNRKLEAGKVNIDQESSFIQYCYPPERKKELEEKLAREKGALDAIFSADEVTDQQKIAAFSAMSVSLSTLRRYTGLQKVEAYAKLVEEELENRAYGKLVIFAIHRDVIEGLKKRLKQFKPVTLYGGFDDAKKQKNLKRFKEIGSVRVCICNIQTAGTAINLTVANQVDFIEQDWVPGNNAQAVMRVHRIGQSRKVFVRFFGIRDSLDEKIAAILKRKTEDLTQIFDLD